MAILTKRLHLQAFSLSHFLKKSFNFFEKIVLEVLQNVLQLSHKYSVNEVICYP